MNLRQRLLAGERLVGTIVTLPDAALAELTAVPFDFVWLDVEHGALDVSDLLMLLPAVAAADTYALVRAPCADSERMPAILDAGVDGIIAPRIETAEDAAAFVRRLLYPPRGTRGYGPRRANGYGRAGPGWEADGSAPTVIVQIESAAGAEASAEIAGVDGVDALVIGTSDLSFDLGRPLDVDTPAFRAAVDAVRSAAADASKAFGVAAGTPSIVNELLGATGTLGVVSVDVRLYAAAADKAAADVRALTPAGLTTGTMP